MLKNFQINRKDLPFINHLQVYDFQYEDDIKGAVEKGKSIVKRAKIEDKKRAKLLKKQKQEKKPFWFKNLSINQVAAANMIFSALQRPTIKDQLNCMNHIVEALKFRRPQPTAEQLTAAIEFSRGSDLAFLWFLYKSVYKSADEICSQKKFSVNEKIVLSCICHLDMTLTLRQLDKILPPAAEKVVKFEKYPVKILQPVPDLKIYKFYDDKFFIIENQQNRWFEREFLIPTKNHCFGQRLIAESLKNAQNSSQNKRLNSCTHHDQESTKLNQFLNTLRQENTGECQNTENLNHLTNSEQNIACSVIKNFNSTENEFRQNQEQKETQIITKTLVNQCVDDAFHQRFLHLCKKCKNSSENCQNLQLQKGQTESLLSTSYNPKAVKYFHQPSINIAGDSFKFDYEKIFSLNFLHDHHRSNNSNVAKKSINAALELNKYLTMDNAITACLRDMWRKKLREWNEKRQAEIEERQQRVVADCSAIGGDKDAAYKLLRRGIALMRKNPKFVLVALPHSHRLPILKEWILQRYRVKYVYEKSTWEQNH